LKILVPLIAIFKQFQSILEAFCYDSWGYLFIYLGNFGLEWKFSATIVVGFQIAGIHWNSRHNYNFQSHKSCRCKETSVTLSIYWNPKAMFRLFIDPYWRFQISNERFEIEIDDLKYPRRKISKPKWRFSDGSWRTISYPEWLKMDSNK